MGREGATWAGRGGEGCGWGGTTSNTMYCTSVLIVRGKIRSDAYFVDQNRRRSQLNLRVFGQWGHPQAPTRLLT